MSCHRRFLLTAALLFVVLTSVAAAARAQGMGVAGRVVDESGGALPGVTVVARGATLLGDRQTVTDATGAYRFDLTNPGGVSLTFELAGFTTVLRENVVVSAGATATVNVALTVAGIAEMITVSGASPVVDRESTAIGVNFTANMLQSLPNARDIWTVLSQAPGVTVARFDVGGSSAGVQTGYQSYGFGGQNYVGLDGIMTTEGTGGAIVYMDYGSFSEVQIVGASKGADIAVPGTYVNSVVKTGSNRFSGELFADWEHKDFQGDNLTPALRAAGVSAGDRVDRYNDVNWSLGGPLRRDRLWFFYSGRRQHVGVQTIGFTDDAGSPVPFYTDLDNHTVKLNARLGNQELSYLGGYNRKYQPYRGGGTGSGGQGRYFTTSSAGEQDMPTPVQKLAWASTSIPQSALDVSLNYVGQDFSILRRVDDVSRRDLDSLLVRGGYSGVGTGFTGTSSNSIPFRWLRNRTHLNTNWSWSTDALGAGSHTIKAGHVYNFEEFKFPQYGTFDHAVYYYRNNFQTPAFVETYDTPLETINRLRQNSVYVNDRWSVAPKVTLNLGVRYDRYTNYYPAQGNDGSGPFADAFAVPALTLPALSNWVPRLSVIYDLFGTGRTAIKGSYGRYAYNTGTTLAESANPVSRTQKRYTWDGTLPFVPSSAALVSTVGGRARGVAGDLSNSYVDEFTAGLDQELMPNVLARFNVVRRLDKNRFQLVNTAIPFEAYSIPVNVPDPGPDGVRGSGDDRTLTLYSLDPAYIGRFAGEVRNTPGYENDYLSYDLQMVKRFADRWDMVAGAVFNRIREWPAANTLTDGGGVPMEPNRAAFSDYRDVWQWTAKVMGTYDAPFDFRVSSVLKSQRGEPFGRQLRSPAGALSQGVITLNVEPIGTYFLPAVTLWDARIERTFTIGGTRLGVMVDVFNILNKATVLTVNTLTGVNFNREVVGILNPRIAKLGLRLSF